MVDILRGSFSSIAARWLHWLFWYYNDVCEGLGDLLGK